MNWYDKKRRILESFYDRLSPDDKLEWATHRKACDKSLFFFIREAGGYMPKSGGDISPIIHKPVLDRWQDPTVTRQCVYMPRSWKKSTCLTQWANVWEYLQNNEVRIIIPSEKEEKASEWLLWVEGQVMGNARLRWLYPELTAVTESYTLKNPWSGKKCRLPRAGIYPESTISVIGISGRAQGGHYDIINPDDMVGERGMESELVLDDAKRWFDNIEGLLIEKDPKAPGASRIRIVGTHWANGDQGHYIQQNYPEYLWYIVPCLKTSKLVDKPNITYIQHPDVAEGESNWPEMFDTSIYTEMMANPEQQSTFWAQYMNNPQDSALNPFDVEWLRYYRIEPRDGHRFIVCLNKDGSKGEEFRLGSFPLYGFVDPGGFSDKKLTKRGSRFALLVGGQPPGSEKKFILYAKAFKFKDPTKTLDEFFKAHLAYDPIRPALWRQELYGTQLYILKDIQLEAKRRGVAVRIMGLEADENKNSKAIGIDALRDPIFRGEVYVQDWMKELKGEVANYPNTTQDVLDLMNQIHKTYWKRGMKPPNDGPPPSSAFRHLASPGNRTGY